MRPLSHLPDGTDEIFNRTGEPGVKREWWYHVPSSTWFIAERDNVTDTILGTYLFGEKTGEDCSG